MKRACMLFAAVACLVATTSAHAQELYATNVTGNADWINPQNAQGNPGCECECNSGGGTPPNPPYALNNAGSNSWLTAAGMENITIPPGACVTAVYLNVQGRFDSTDTGFMDVGFKFNDQATWLLVNQAPTPMFSSSDNKCKWRFTGKGWNITGLNGGQWTQAEINKLQLRVKRQNGLSTSARVRAFRIIVETAQTASITMHPASVQVCKNSPNLVNFSIEAAGTLPLNYQWKRNGANVGINANQLSLPVNLFNSGDQVWCEVGGACGSLAASNKATVTILQPASAQILTLSQFLPSDSNLTLESVTGGTGIVNVKWQWSYGAGFQDIDDGATTCGTFIGGTDTKVLSISKLRGCVSGAYRVRVWNDCGTAFSPSVQVQVCEANCDKSEPPNVLNIDDFICFQTAFAGNDKYADCDGNGTLSIDDFICFQTLFAVGC